MCTLFKLVRSLIFHFCLKTGIHAQNYPVYLTNSSIKNRHHRFINQKSKINVMEMNRFRFLEIKF
ncbi:MAG: hypothetical protein C6Y22_11935 [Hapalosiphonaceae cyanobacterium JJU2]|nr:MAG: hypothetical protein C6Y22_11935 [Hapalosiphonaceae cyanobacterium JJU2]